VSRENVEALRSLYAELAEGKIWAAGKLLAPHVVSSWPEPEGRVICRGRDELVLRLRNFLDYWGDYRVEAQEFRRLNQDSVLVVARQHGRGEWSGVEVGSTIFTVWTFSERKVVGQHWALELSEALDAAGLAE
jgi:hypothetical protein